MSVSKERSSNPASRIEREAIAWFTRLNGEPAPVDRRDFERWRTASPAHDAAFRQVEAMWQAVERPGSAVAAEEQDKLAVYLEAMDDARARRREGKRRLAVAGALMVMVLGAAAWLEYPNALQNLRADYATARGERRTVELGDGSTVLLDADSALDVTFTAGERRVTLLRGNAFFAVTSSPIPFVVEAREGKTVVHGTAFDVAIADDDVAVTLAEGSVSVASADGRATLQPGQRVHYDRSGVGAVTEVAIDDAMAWHGGRYVFDNARLGDVVAQIERYRPGRLVVVSPSLANHRISGSFPLADPDRALVSIQSIVGFRMIGLGGKLVLIGV